MILRGAQIILMAGAAGLSYWGWIMLNSLRGTPLFEYRYIILLCGVILLFSLAQFIAGVLERRIPFDDP